MDIVKWLVLTAICVFVGLLICCRGILASLIRRMGGTLRKLPYFGDLMNKVQEKKELKNKNSPVATIPEEGRLISGTGHPKVEIILYNSSGEHLFQGFLAEDCYGTTCEEHKKDKTLPIQHSLAHFLTHKGVLTVDVAILDIALYNSAALPVRKCFRFEASERLEENGPKVLEEVLKAITGLQVLPNITEVHKGIRGRLFAQKTKADGRSVPHPSVMDQDEYLGTQQTIPMVVTGDLAEKFDRDDHGNSISVAALLRQLNLMSTESSRNTVESHYASGFRVAISSISTAVMPEALVRASAK